VEFNYGENAFKGGVYKITNKLNDRIYIGSTKGFKPRWQAHASALRKERHPNKFLQRDFNKCGTDAFVFDIVEGTEGTKEERLLKEDQYISIYFGLRCYNLRTSASSSEGRSCEDLKERKRHFAAKEFRLLSPKGKIYSGTNITKFCEEHNLCKENITAILNENSKSRKSHMGWRNADNPRFENKKSDFKWESHNHPRRVEFCLKSPGGEMVHAWNIRNFCKENDLNPGCIGMVLHNIRPQHKGWTKPTEEEQNSIISPANG